MATEITFKQVDRLKACKSPEEWIVTICKIRKECGVEGTKMPEKYIERVLLTGIMRDIVGGPPAEAYIKANPKLIDKAEYDPSMVIPVWSSII